MQIDYKMIPSELVIWLILEPGQGKFMMSLEHFMVPESKGWGERIGYVKRTGADL